jgi:hypothetical protein
MKPFHGACLLLLAFALTGCGAPKATPLRWGAAPPPVTAPTDLFTVRVLELDAEGRPKDPAQLRAVLEAADQAEDAFLFIHGWRRDARDLPAMKAFVQIYRQAFDCLSGRDVEGTEGCAATHAFCHPKGPASKLVVLVLWDARSGLLGFKATQRRAQHMGAGGLLDLLRQLHARIGPRGTFLAMGHSLGGAALMAALQQASKEGPLPLDGALLLMGAFDVAPLELRPAASDSGGPVLLNLFNRRDGYLRAYRWVWGHAAAGATGLAGVPVTDGARWEKEGGSCGADEATVGAALLDQAQAFSLPKGGGLEALNLDITPLVHGHVDIERLPAIRLYNRAVAEAIFRVLWQRVEAPTTEAQP